MAAQHAVPIAIAVAEMAAAERRRRAEIELIVDAAMVRAIRPVGEVLERAVVAEHRRQLLRCLPIGVGGRCRSNAGQNGKDNRFHHRVPSRSSARIRTGASEGSAIDGASATAAGATARVGFIGNRMTKREPSPSRLVTSTPPPCKSTAILTRYSPTPVPTMPETLLPR